jgi:uncharacterized BrkB/YihY/UPF0761 family membrane protein
MKGPTIVTIGLIISVIVFAILIYVAIVVWDGHDLDKGYHLDTVRGGLVLSILYMAFPVLYSVLGIGYSIYR